MIKTVSVFHRNLYLLVLNVGNGWEWELLGLLLIVGQWIIPENSLRLAQVSPIGLLFYTFQLSSYVS